MAKKTKFKLTLVRGRVQLFAFLFGTGIFYFLANLEPIKLKRFPMPWLVCWSDPLAVGACPAGTIQHFFTIGAFPFFAIGFLALIGAIFGRMSCSWLCPFGYVQDLIYKMRDATKWIIVTLLALVVVYLCWTSPVFATKPLRKMLGSKEFNSFYLWIGLYIVIFGAVFSPFFIKKIKKFTIGNTLANYGRFFFFLILFLLFPLFVEDPSLGTNGPWFCKLCPSGSLFAAIPQFLINSFPRSWFPPFGLQPNSPFVPYGMSSYQDIRSMGQVMFGLKITMLILLIWVFTRSKRAFCKFACPIGFIYSGFNYFSATRVVIDKEICKAEKCNICWKICPMDIKLYDRGSTSHCIGCLECVTRCPHKAAQLVRPSYLNWLFPRRSFTIATKKNVEAKAN